MKFEVYITNRLIKYRYFSYDFKEHIPNLISINAFCYAQPKSYRSIIKNPSPNNLSSIYSISIHNVQQIDESTSRENIILLPVTIKHMFNDIARVASNCVILSAYSMFQLYNCNHTDH